MGLNRFKLLLQVLRFDDVSSADREHRRSQDKFYCMREFFDDFIRHCQENYSHSAYVTIDEMLQNFRGKCSFRVYMPKKPGKFGIKIWALTDSKTFYTSNMEVYIPKQKDGPYKVDNSTRALVNRLVSGIQNTGRNVTCDNYFTSVPVARDLLSKRLTMVGTIRKNKREIPRELVIEDKGNKRPLKSSIFAFTSTETLVSYKPQAKKLVILLSTLHESDEIDRDSGEEHKPSIITAYNKLKCGVDVCDAMQKDYTVARISNRWPLTMFYFELNVGGINAYIIWKANNQPTAEGGQRGVQDRSNFLFNLGRQLLHENAKRRTVASYPIPRPMKDRLAEISNIEKLQQPVAGPIQHGLYSICGICPRRKNRRTKVICNSCNVPVCREHTVPTCTRCSSQQEKAAECD
nr:unnamed protein product [Callosobruchus chinensis]